MSDAETVCELRISRDPCRAGETPEAVLPPGDLTCRILLNSDECAVLTDGDRPTSREASSPYGGGASTGHGLKSLRGGGERGPEFTIDMEQPVVVLVGPPGGMVGFKDVDCFRQWVTLYDHADDVHNRVGIDRISVLVRERRREVGDQLRVGVWKQVRYVSCGLLIQECLCGPSGSGPVLMHEVNGYRGPTRRPAAHALRDIVPVQVLKGFAKHPDPALVAERSIPSPCLYGTQDQADDGEPVDRGEVRHVGVHRRFQTAADMSSFPLCQATVLGPVGLIAAVRAVGQPG